MRVIRILAVMLCAAISGCASMRGAAGPRTKSVSIKSFAFDPDKIEISLGDTVEWVNHDAFTHSAVADAKSFNTGKIPSEERRTFAPRSKGEWTYHCSWHPNMRGKIVVK